MKTKQNINSSQMKNIFLLMLLFTGMVKAQIVNIPDANFKAFLIAANTTPCAYNQLDNAVGIDINNDGEIQNTEAAAIYRLVINNKTMQDLIGIDSFVNLTKVEITNNAQLTSINLAGLSNLNNVNISNNQLLSSVNFNGLTNLTILKCIGSHQLASIDFSTLINVTSLAIYGNILTSLNFPTPNRFQSIDCGGNNLTTIDVSNCPDLISLAAESNSSLTSVFMKNGRNNDLHCIPCSNLIYICADESESASFPNIFNFTGQNPNGVINSYCSFSPGGNYNTISGNIKYDSNNNGCDASDLPRTNIRVNINDGTNTGVSFSSSSGNYTFYTQAGSFDIAPSIENPTWFNFSPATATIPFADNNNNTATQDFCISPNGFHPDVEVVISPVFFARPGFDATYQITYRNKGNQTFSEGLVGLQYDDAVLDFVSASQATFSQAAGNINWQYTNLFPFESRTIIVTLNVNSPTETPAVNIGNVLNFVVSTFPLEADENPEDNTFQYIQTVVGSYDPNDITCLEGDVVAPSEIGNYLHYAINFENTGTFPAENIVVKTEVDASKFDIGSLQLMNTNFPVDARISGNKVEFIFKNIQLPIGGHGHILLKIKTNETLVVGDAVANRADVFFDYNFPIDTGLANTVFQTLSNTDFEIDDSVLVAPNPASSEVIVKADNVIKSIQLFDVQGRILHTSLVEEMESKLDISSHDKGLYFIKIKTDKGSNVQKLLKE
jgi:hypothetical protein